VRKDENGESCPSTLGEYRDLCWALARECRAVELLDHHILKNEDGRDAVVIAHDSQMRFLLMPALAEPPEDPEHDFLNPACASERALERGAEG
jgi:hypothetical protein